MKVQKRKNAVNSFGDNLYIPEAPDLDLDLDTDAPEFEGDMVDTNLFDYDRTDNNTDCRYMRPRPTRVPNVCVRYDNADAFAKSLKIDKGTRIDAFISGSFIFGDFIEAFLKRNNCKATQMTIATLSMSEENVDSLYLLMKRGYLDNLRLMISDFYFAHERHTMIPYIYRKLDIEERFQLGVCRIHTKTCHFTTLGGKKIVIHGSANLRANGCVEQMTIEEDPKLYDFYEDTYNLLFGRYSTINHKVTSRASWNEFEKLLDEK